MLETLWWEFKIKSSASLMNRLAQLNPFTASIDMQYIPEKDDIAIFEYSMISSFQKKSVFYK